MSGVLFLQGWRLDTILQLPCSWLVVGVIVASLGAVVEEPEVVHQHRESKAVTRLKAWPP